ncbi:MAG: CocE/NonD family hydrolase C-terminal non-catalytic domain-containing protein, partial [Myxococcales bacterium]
GGVFVIGQVVGVHIAEGALRMRYRESLSREKLMTPGRAYRVEVDLWTTAIVFNRGHRVRVHVTSSSYPAYDPNPNTGEPFRASELYALIDRVLAPEPPPGGV